jgi:hypothetical protein
MMSLPEEKDKGRAFSIFWAIVRHMTANRLSDLSVSFPLSLTVQFRFPYGSSDCSRNHCQRRTSR